MRPVRAPVEVALLSTLETVASVRVVKQHSGPARDARRSIGATSGARCPQQGATTGKLGPAVSDRKNNETYGGSEGRTRSL